MMLVNRILISFLSFLIIGLPLIAGPTRPVTMLIQDIFVDTSLPELLNGPHSVTLSLKSSDTAWTGPSLRYDNVEFVRGQFRVLLGAGTDQLPNGDLLEGDLNHPDLYVQMSVQDMTSTFSISSQPYAIVANVAESIDPVHGLVNPANITGDFDTVTVGRSLIVSGNSNSNLVHIPTSATGIGIGKVPVSGLIDVQGTVNATSYNINGVPLADAVSWKKQSTNPLNIYYDGPGFIGVDTSEPRFPLEVRGTINASAVFQNGRPLVEILDWIPTENDSIYQDDPDLSVGIGTIGPHARLDVRQAVLIGNSDRDLTGNIRYNGNFEANVGGTERYKSLTGLSGGGQENHLALWGGLASRSQHVVGSQIDIVTSNQFIGINSNEPTSSFVIRGSPSISKMIEITNSENFVVFNVPQTGGISVSTNNATFAVNVGGPVNASRYFLNGRRLEASISNGTFWLIGNDDNIYYNLDRVGIGRPPGEGSSTLKLSQIQGRGDEVNPEDNQDVALTVTDLLNSRSYTMGVDAGDVDSAGNRLPIFRVEEGTSLGDGDPLFVSFQDRLGIGLDFPVANLSVSGNLGLLLNGKFNLQSTRNAPIEGPGTRLMFMPERAAFRVGHVEAGSLALGTEWDGTNLGFYSVGFGLNPYPSGNFSTTAGENNRAMGAFSTVLNGQGNLVDNFASTVGGRRAISRKFGNFTWADGIPADFEAATANSFVMRVQNLGIGTANTTVPFQGVDRSALLTVAGRYIFPTEFEDLVGSTTNSTTLFNHLVSTGIVSPNGHVSRQADFSTPLNLSGLSFSGVSLGTIEPTLRARLAEVATRNLMQFVDRVSGTKVDTAFTGAGGLSIGTTNRTEALLTLIDDELTIATKNPIAALTVLATQSSTLTYNMFQVDATASSPTPAVLVDGDGHISFGQVAPSPLGLVRIPTLTAVEMRLTDGTILSSDIPVVVWTTTNLLPFDPDDPNARRAIGTIYYTSGNVGIGTPSPNSLLELSSRGSSGASNPVIRFTESFVPRFEMGVNNPSTPGFTVKYLPTSGIESPIFVGTSNVGFGTHEPLMTLTVTPSAIFDHHVYVDTTNFSSSTAGVTAPSANASLVLIDRSIATPWFDIDGSTSIHHPTEFSGGVVSLVGIGTTQPSVELEVVGTINVTTSGSGPSVKISDLFSIKGDLISDDLFFTDTGRGGGDTARFFIQSNELALRQSGITFFITDSFNQGVPVPGQGGGMAAWEVPEITGTTINETNLTYLSPVGSAPAKFIVSGNVGVTSSSQIESFVASREAFFGTGDMTKSILLRDELTHDGRLSQSQSYTSNLIDLVLDFDYTQADWLLHSPADEEVSVKGVEIIGENLSGTSFTQNGTFIGLRSDVTNVEVQSVGDRGFKYPLIVNSGNVGIGIETPSVQLEVSGNVVATRFVISNGISIVTLNMEDGALFVGETSKVGMGTTEPTHELTVVGSMSYIDALAGGVEASSLTAGDFSTASTGKVGVGNTSPDAQFDLAKTFTEVSSEDFQFYAVQATSNVAGTATHDLTGVEIDLGSFQSSSLLDQANRLGTITGTGKSLVGYDIDLTDIDVNTTGRVVGLEIIVSDSARSSKNAALFPDGIVGVGTTTPSTNALLTVRGTLRATNVPSIDLLRDQETGSFNRLAIPTAFTTEIKDRMFVRNIVINRLRQDQISIETLASLNIDVDIQGLLTSDELHIKDRLTAGNLRLNRNVTANNGRFSFMDIGTNATSARLEVDQLLRTDTLISTANLSANSLNANNGTFIVSDSQAFIGGQLTHFSRFSINDDSGSSLVVPNNQTWASVILQNGQDTAGRAAGLTLLGQPSNKHNVGSGLAAVRVVSTDDASDLVFVTDPNLASPEERARLTATGNLAIGKTLASKKLEVSGNAIISGTLSSSNELEVQAIQGIKDSGASINGPAVIVSTTNFTQGLFLQEELVIQPGSRIDPPSTTRMPLFVDSATSRLALSVDIGGRVVSGDLGVTISGTSQNFPFFNDGRTMGSTSGMTWSTAALQGFPTLNRLLIQHDGSLSSGNQHGKFVGLISTANTSGSHTLGLNQWVFGTRTTERASRFSGLDIVGTATALGDDESITGLKVDLRDTLRNRSFLLDGTPINGDKIAATFMVGSDVSGNLGIYPQNATLEHVPSASLHVKLNSLRTPPLMVQTFRGTTTVNALVVSADRKVGISVLTPNATLHLASLVATRDALIIKDSEQASLLVLSTTGNLGIGLSTPTTAVGVNGLLMADRVSANGLSMQTLSMPTSNGLTVLSSGLVGIGTAIPSGQLHIVRSFPSPNALAANFVMSEKVFNISDTTTVTRSLTGTMVRFADTNAFLGTAQTATLMQFRSPLKAHEDAKVIGLDVNVIEHPRSIAALMMGGNVGIGLTAPTQLLSINGTLKANSFIGTTPNLIVTSGNIADLIVSGNAIFDKAVLSTHNRNLRANLIAGAGVTVDQSITLNSMASVPVAAATSANFGFLNSARIGVGGSTTNHAVKFFVEGAGAISGSTTFKTGMALNLKRLVADGTLLMPTFAVVPTFSIEATSDAKTVVARLKGAATVPPTQNSFSRLMFLTDRTFNFSGAGATGESSISVNFTTQALGTSGRMPFFGSQGEYAESDRFTWTSATPNGKTYREETLQIGKGTSVGSSGVAEAKGLDLQLTVPATSTVGDRTAQTIRMAFLDRSELSHAVNTTPSFTGTDITMKGTLDDTDLVRGLYVNMKQSNGSTELPFSLDSIIQPKIRAAVFLSGVDSSGNVGIYASQSSPTLKPEAALHLAQGFDYADFPTLIVRSIPEDTTAVTNGFTISNEGDLGVGFIRKPSAQLHVTSSVEILRIENSDSTVIVAASQNMGIGIATASSKLHVRGASTAALNVNTTRNANAIHISNAGESGFGTQIPSSDVHIVFDRDLPSFIEADFIATGTGPSFNQVLSASNSPFGLASSNVRQYLGCTDANNVNVYAFVYRQNGVRKLYDLQCFGSSGSPLASNFANMRIYDDKVPFLVSQNALVVEQNGLVGIGTRLYPESAQLSGVSPNRIHTPTENRRFSDLLVGGVSGNILAGDNPSHLNNLWFTSSTSKPRFTGFLASTVTSTQTDFAALGVFKSVPADTSFSSAILWGRNQNSDLSIRNATAEIMRFNGDGTVMKNTSVSKNAVFHLEAPAAGAALVVNGELPNLLVVTDNKIGILTTTPSALVDVNGIVRAEKFVNAPTGSAFGSSANITLSFVNRPSAFNVTKKLADDYGVDATVNVKQISGIVKADTQRDFVLYNVRVSQDIKQSVPAQRIPLATKVYGVHSDLTDLSVEPTLADIEVGRKFPAVFLGGKVLIGDETSATGDSVLEVVPLVEGAKVTDGVVALFRSTTASRLVNGTQLRENVIENMRLNVSPNTTVSRYITPNDLRILIDNRTGDPITFTGARYLYERLRDFHFISANRRVSPNITHMTAQMTAKFNSISNTSIIGDIDRVSLLDLLVRHVTLSNFQLFSEHAYTVASTRSTKNATMILAASAGITENNRLYPGLVGIGFNKKWINNRMPIDSTLTVSGDIRIGVSQNTTLVGTPGYGNVLFFSGGDPAAAFSTDLATSLDSENNDTLWMARFNKESNATELRVGVGDTNTVSPHAKMTIGYANEDWHWGTTHNILTAGVFGYVDDLGLAAVPEGRVGIATNNPVTLLHVYGTKNVSSLTADFNATSSPNFLAIIENTSNATTTVSGLAITHSQGANLGAVSSFISFMKQGSVATTVSIVGAIQGDGNGGVSYASPAADYAEYLPKQDLSQSFKKGDVVGIKHGKITKDTESAEQIMVISSSPIVAGNWQYEDDHPGFELVAFLGQVPVSVRGKVSAGDFLVPSGRNDGSAIAVSPDQLSEKHMNRVIGRAWEGSKKRRLKKVNTIIGFPFDLWALKSQLPNADELLMTISDIETANQKLESEYTQILAERDEKIKALQAMVAKKLKGQTTL